MKPFYIYIKYFKKISKKLSGTRYPTPFFSAGYPTTRFFFFLKNPTRSGKTRPGRVGKLVPALECPPLLICMVKKKYNMCKV